MTQSSPWDLPEVLLGIHPGFGGTVRTVRLIGVRPALELMLKGKPFKGARALEVGLIDQLVPPAESGAMRQAAAAAAVGRAIGAVRREAAEPQGPAALHCARRPARPCGKRCPREHYPAPYAILDLWLKYGATGAESYEAEARSISELMCSPTSRSLVRVFLLQDRLKSLGGKAHADFRHVHVVGAGVMGGDIAAWAALRGMTVTLQDRTAELIKPALARAKAYFDKRLERPQGGGRGILALVAWTWRATAWRRRTW